MGYHVHDVICVILHLVVLSQYRRVTNGHDDSKYRASIASRG